MLIREAITDRLLKEELLAESELVTRLFVDPRDGHLEISLTGRDSGSSPPRSGDGSSVRAFRKGGPSVS